MSRMDPVEVDEGETEIAPGRRLIRADDAGQGLFGRLSYKLQRFMWRTPIHQVRLRGKMPLRLVAVPKDRSPDDMAHGVPVTYVPARNTILLGLALGYAETVGAFDIFIGANVLDYSGYPDCRPEFLAAFENLADLATKAGTEGAGKFRVHSPLLKLTKAEIVREGVRLGVDYALTLSCYDPDAEGRACGRCDSCQLRKKGFAEAGVPDPTRYQ